MILRKLYLFMISTESLFLVAGSIHVPHRTVQSVLPEGVTNCEPIDDTEAPSFRTASDASILTHREHVYCMNYGACKTNYTNDYDNPCDCLEGFSGPHCEFSTATAPTNCTKDCKNGGKCKIGAPTWTDAIHELHYNVSAKDMQYCSCTPDYFGNVCEFAMEEFIPCGEGSDAKPCLHGGLCVTTSGSNDSSIQYHCDCTTANLDGIDRAGLYCENEATTTCADDHNGIQFCVNGGSCKSESHLGCNCPDGFVGPICEFKDLAIKPTECNLDCVNQGICRKGAKDIAVLEKLGLLDNGNRRLEDLDEKYNEDFEHCVCPSGFLGLRCEHEIDVCPGDEYACLNGGECRTTLKGGHIHFECDCINAIDEVTNQRFAGSNCEMVSTQFCTLDGTMALVGPPANAFCTNGGSCNKLINATGSESHGGCICAKGFGGENCQYIVDVTGSSNTAEDSSKREYMLIGLFAGLVIAFSTLFAIRLYYKRQNKLQPKGENFYVVDPYDTGNSRAQIVGDLITFGPDEKIHNNIFGGDDSSCSSSKASHSTTGSSTTSKRRTSKRLKKLKKKRFSTLDRTITQNASNLTTSNDANTISDVSDNNNDRDGLLFVKQGNYSNEITATTKSTLSWPNSTKDPTDTSSIFNEIDLGDDYGINLVT